MVSVESTPFGILDTLEIRLTKRKGDSREFKFILQFNRYTKKWPVYCDDGEQQPP